MDGGGDLWSGWCPRCRCVNYLIRSRLTHHVEQCSKGSNECNGGLGRIPPLGVVAVVVVVVVSTAVVVVVAVVVVSTAVVVVVAVVVVARGSVLFDECGECKIVTAAKRALHMSACPNQGCKSGDGLDAE